MLINMDKSWKNAMITVAYLYIKKVGKIKL